MHEVVQQLTEETKEALGLSDFNLKNHQLYKEMNHKHEVTYILNMEWVPVNAEETEDFHPPGTVSIDIDIHSKRMKSLIFIEGVNELEADLPNKENVESAIEWIEETTGLEFGRQFKMENTEGADLLFTAAVDNIPVFPTGYIELEFNEAGKLSLYSFHGNFPDAENIDWEPFNLTEEKTEETIREQCKLLEVPIVEEEKWLNLYVVSSCFISNDGKEVLSYEEVEADPTHVFLDKTLEWEQPTEKSFTTKEIDQSTEVTIEEALSSQENTLQPLTEADQHTAIDQTKEYLSSINPQESGKWKITSLHREERYVLAVLRPTEEENRVITRKLTVFLDGNTLEPVNHIDNEILLEAFKEFEAAAPAGITVENAFDTLYSHMEITPVYLYDKRSDRYKLYGRVDSPLGIDANSGELIEMKELN